MTISTEIYQWAYNQTNNGKPGQVWGDKNCTGFVFTDTWNAGVPFFYSRSVDHREADRVGQSYNNPNNPNDVGFVTPVQSLSTDANGSRVGAIWDSTSGVPLATWLDGIQARPDTVDHYWTLVNGGAPSYYFSIFGPGLAQPQQGDLFRGVTIEANKDLYVLHSGVVAGYNPMTNQVCLISNWDYIGNGQSKINEQWFTVIDPGQVPVAGKGPYILSNKATFYRPISGTSSSAVMTNAQTADSSIITVTGSDQLIDPGSGSYTIQFMAGASADTLVLHASGVDQVSGFNPNSDFLDFSSLLSGANIDLKGNLALLANYVGITDQGSDALVSFAPNGQGSGSTVAVLHGLGSTVTSLNSLIAAGAVKIA